MGPGKGSTGEGPSPRGEPATGKEPESPLEGEALVKEVARRIRLARSQWDAHNNAACRGEREKALKLYSGLTKEQKDGIPQELRVWLRYRSEKYFGAGRTPPGAPRKTKPPRS